MTEQILRDLAPELAGRIRALAELRGVGAEAALAEVLDAGVRACEQALRKHLDAQEQAALRHAISALEGVPDDPGFGLIGRLETDAQAG
jgi:hypothetical protein